MEKDHAIADADFYTTLEEYLIIYPDKEVLAHLMSTEKEVVEAWLNRALAPHPHAKEWTMVLKTLMPEMTWH